MNDSLRWKVRLILTVLLLLAILPACQPSEKEEVVRIGVLAILSGNETYISLSGQPTVDGATLALQEIEQAGWITIGDTTYRLELIIADDGGTPETAVAAANNLINQEGVVALIGPQFSSNAIPVGAVAEQARIPMISPMATAVDLTVGRDYVFRIGFIDSFQGQVMARFAMSDLDATRAAIYYNVGEAYSRGIAEIFRSVFTEAGGEIVAFESYTADALDFTEALTRIQTADPDVLFLPNYPAELVPLVQEARALGIETTFLGSDTWNSLAFGEIPELTGSFYATHWNQESDAATSRAFVAAFQAAYPDKALRITSAMTYDALGLIVAAIRDQGAATPEAIRNGLANVRDYSGVSGQIVYEGSGDPIKSAVIMQIQGDSASFYRLVNP